MDQRKRRSDPDGVAEPDAKRKRASLPGESSERSEVVDLADVNEADSESLSLLGREADYEDTEFEDLSDDETQPPAATEAQFVERRQHHLRQLSKTYQVMFWSAAEEYRARIVKELQNGSVQVKGEEAVPLRRLLNSTSGHIKAEDGVTALVKTEDGDTTLARAEDDAEPEALFGDHFRGFGSDEDIPSTDAVIQALSGPLTPAVSRAVDSDSMRAWRVEMRREMPRIARLEQAACAEMARELDSVGALAALYLADHRFLIFRTCISFGRSPACDVSWHLVTDSKSPSREGGFIELQYDGTWLLHVTGRTVLVNNMEVQEDEAVVLKQYSLIDVGQLPCIFYINQRAVARVLLRSTRNYCFLA